MNLFFLNLPKPGFKLSADLNLETFDTILSGTNHIKAAAYKFKPPLKFFKSGHWHIYCGL